MGDGLTLSKQDEQRARVRVTEGNRQADVTVAGVFRMRVEQPSPADERLVEYNAPSILLGIIRGAVSTLTAPTAHGRIELPSVNLVAMVDN